MRKMEEIYIRKLKKLYKKVPHTCPYCEEECLSNKQNFRDDMKNVYKYCKVCKMGFTFDDSWDWRTRWEITEIKYSTTKR